ncbi:MAG: hypothetical protein CBC04_03840 [Verrucomicrobia bacterium TMED44]|nr:MAG: hypothetical protein CBC04_03840 [Verrucomicrobia bacterium TMED44]
MTRYASRQDYEAALADPNSIENQMFGNTSPTQSSPFEGLSEDLFARSQYNQGIGSLNSIKRLLSPILENIERQSKMEFREKIDPYVQQVEQLTQQTFPNIDFSMNSNIGVRRLGGGLLFPPGGMPSGSLTEGQNQFQDLTTALPAEQSGSINTSPFANSLLNQGLGSLFK